MKIKVAKKKPNKQSLEFFLKLYLTKIKLYFNQHTILARSFIHWTSLALLVLYNIQNIGLVILL